MTGGRVTVEWAWISKEPGREIGYGVLAASVGDTDVGRYGGRYVVGTPNSSMDVSLPGAPPWLTFGPFLAAATGPLISVSVIDPRQNRDQAGRPIWPQRFFLMRYNEVAEARASYQGLWNAVRDVRLPALDRLPLLLEPRAQSVDDLVTTVERRGRDRMTSLAAMILEGPVALTESAQLSRDERLAVLDAIVALLPYGFRAAISASSAVDNNVRHSVDLVFAEYANIANNQTLVPLSVASPVPVPRTAAGRAYRDLLREKILTFGIRAVVEHLWAATEARSLARPEEARAILRELPPPTNVLSVSRAAISRETTEAAEILAKTADRERVQFTASYPGMLAPGIWYPLYVHVHRDGIRDQLEIRLAELDNRLGPRPRRAEVPANSIIAPGTELEIQPVITNARVTRLVCRWCGTRNLRRQSLRLSMSARLCRQYLPRICPGTGRWPTHRADTDIIRDTTLSGVVSVPEPQTTSASMIRDVFGSYAHEDADIVDRFRAVYRALGIHLFVDVLDIDGGQLWRRYLEQKIEGSDLFQLFWSAASAASKAVEHEWRHALEVARKRPPGISFSAQSIGENLIPRRRSLSPTFISDTSTRKSSASRPPRPTPLARAEHRLPAAGVGTPDFSTGPGNKSTTSTWNSRPQRELATNPLSGKLGQIIFGAAPAAAVAAGHDVGLDVGHQLADLRRGGLIQAAIAPLVEDSVPARAVRPPGVGTTPAVLSVTLNVSEGDLNTGGRKFP